MSPSKPLTSEQKIKRKFRRRERELLADIASTPLMRAPDGRLGYFVPTAHDPSMRPGDSRLART